MRFERAIGHNPGVRGCAAVLLLGASLWVGIRWLYPAVLTARLAFSGMIAPADITEILELPYEDHDAEFIFYEFRIDDHRVVQDKQIVGRGQSSRILGEPGPGGLYPFARAKFLKSNPMKNHLIPPQEREGDGRGGVVVKIVWILSVEVMMFLGLFTLYFKVKAERIKFRGTR